MKKKVVIPQYITQSAKKFLQERGYEVVDGYNVTERTMLKQIISDADALLVRTAPFDADILSAAPKCQVISRQGVGYDNIDIDYCTKNNIWVTYAPQANFHAVAEHTIGLIIALAHNIVSMDKEVRRGNWNLRNERKGRELFGKTLGIIGFGRIGSAVAQKAHDGIGMNIIAYDTNLDISAFPSYVQKSDTLEELLQKADIISIHVISNKQTVHMVDWNFLKKMKPDAMLINCSRGNIIQESDLYSALASKIIAGAAVDVMEEEPPKTNHPLFSLDNFIVTPHNAALLAETMDRMGLDAAIGIDDVLSGRIPRWAVNQVSSSKNKS